MAEVLVKRKVQAVHAAVERAIQRAVSIDLAIVPAAGRLQQWWRVPRGDTVLFELQPKNDGLEFVTFPDRSRMSGIRLHRDVEGDVVAVFGYRERWVCSRAEEFSLVDASITAGVMSLRGQGVPVIRADWDAREPSVDVPRTQPHWNAFDSAVSDEMWANQEVVAEGVAVAAEEVLARDDAGRPRPRLEGLHWPMGGWLNRTVPSKWGLPFTVAGLPVWAEAVVEHLRDELGNDRYLRFSP